MHRKLILGLFLSISFGCTTHKKTLNTKTIENQSLNSLSEQLLDNIQKSESTKEIQDQLANITIDAISTQLSTDEHKFAFWINIYNAYIQIILSEHPELYENRKAFFSKEQIALAGRMFSFKQIEHGLIRKSQWEFGLGYFRTWFTDRIERQLRVTHRDYRIHFALNCGAKDCPPVRIYKPQTLESQLEKSTTAFLNNSTQYDSSNNTANITSLFSWFRGDFGGKRGIKKIIRHYTEVESDDFNINYLNYDWNLDLGNFYFD